MDTANNNNTRKENVQYDWAQNAENAAQKAEAEIDKIKKEAQDEFNKNKPNIK